MVVVPKTVRLLAFSASAVVLARAFCLVCCRALVSLSNLLRGLSQLRLPSLQSSWLLQRPVTVELFAPPVISVLLLLKRFLDGLHLVLQLGSFLFHCGIPRHLLHRYNLAPI